MKRIAILFVMLLLGACSAVDRSITTPEEYTPVSNKEVLYEWYRFKVIDLVDVEQLSKKYVLVYLGTFDSYHLLVALPSDKFSFNEKEHYALHVAECEIPDSYYPDQSLFYNFTEVKDWKAIKVEDGACLIKQDTQLRFLF